MVDDHQATARDPTYDNYPIEGKNRADVEWIGVQGTSGPAVLYEEHTDTVYEATVDEENRRIVPANPEPLGDRSLGEYLEEFAEEHGLESLSEFAEEHLESESEDGEA